MPVRTTNWWVIFFSVITEGAFFIGYASWKGISIPGYYLPSGEFFSVSKREFGLGNPYPRFDFALYVFWLIPVLALGTLALSLTGKKTGVVAGLAGLLALSMATVFVLFTNTLLQLGIGKSLLSSLRFGIYLTIIGGLGLILAGTRANVLPKLGLILTGPLFVFLSFKVVEKRTMNETYDDSSKLKPDFVVNGTDLMNEFRANDSLANAKYREKIIEVRGRVSDLATSDSTVNVKLSDSYGSYIIFPLEKNYLEAAKKLTVNDSVIIKGSCSGGIYSEILETEAITFKRCALIKQ
jgi:hypothetical protein